MHRTSIARIRLATPAQLRVVDKLLEPKEMKLPDAAYKGTKLADDPRYGKPCGSAQLAKSDHRDGIGFRGNVSQVVLAGNSDILAARCRVEPYVDPGGSDKVSLNESVCSQE